MSDVEINPDSSETITEQPRFLQASRATEALLKSGDQELIAAYFDIIPPSDLPRVAQAFDVTVNNIVPIMMGDATTITKVIRKAAEDLRQAIVDYPGPTEIVQIYADLYDQPIKQILGEENNGG